MDIEYPDRFVRHLRSLLNKEKIVTALDRNLQRIEPLVKGQSRMIAICELPEVITNKEKGENEFNRLRMIVDIISGMRK